MDILFIFFLLIIIILHKKDVYEYFRPNELQFTVCPSENKEEMMQIIGGIWRESYSNRLEKEKADRKKGPKVGDKRARSQFKQNTAAQDAARRALAARRAKKKKY